MLLEFSLPRSLPPSPPLSLFVSLSLFLTPCATIRLLGNQAGCVMDGHCLLSEQVDSAPAVPTESSSDQDGNALDVDLARSSGAALLSSCVFAFPIAAVVGISLL